MLRKRRFIEANKRESRWTPYGACKSYKAEFEDVQHSEGQISKTIEQSRRKERRERREEGRKIREAISCVDVFLKDCNSKEASDENLVLMIIRRKPQVTTVFLTFCQSLTFLKL